MLCSGKNDIKRLLAVRWRMAIFTSQEKPAYSFVKKKYDHPRTYMKKHALFLGGVIILLMMASTGALAQTQITENYLVTGPFTDFTAPMKYSYIVSDEGERVMHGPISISGKQSEKYGNVTITGSYLLNASAKKGDLNGAMTVKANYHGVKQLFRGQEVEDYAYSFSGSFLNGEPNGTFTAKATNFGSSTATYKKGVLVGAYSVNEILDDRILRIKGSFSDSGKMIGVWDIEILGDKSVWEFVNGTRIRVSSKQEESTPKQIEMAKKYALGTISAEELEKEGYVPVRDSIQLGDYANDLYFLSFIADWQKLPYWSFTKSLWVKYTYLYNILPIPEAKFEEILSDFRNDGESSYPLVRYDEMSKAYTIEYPANNTVIRRRFTNEQVQKVKEAIDLYCREKPIESIETLFTELRIRNRSNVPSLYGIDKRFEEIKTLTEYSWASLKYESLFKDVESASKILNEQLKDKEKTPDGEFLIIPVEGKWSQPFTVRYLPTAVVEEFNSFENEVKGYGAVLERKAEEDRIAREKKAEEDRIAKEQAKEEKRNTSARLLLENLSGIEKQSKNKVTSHLAKIIVSMDYNYYRRVPKNALNITATELAEAIAPTSEYSIREIVEDESNVFDTYKVVVDFKRKKEIVPVSMSVTKDGKIIDGTIVIPDEMLERAKRNEKAKQAVSDIFKL